MGDCVWGECGKVCWVVGKVGGEIWRVWGKLRRDVGDVKKFWGNVWESEWGECGGCRKVCWGEGEGKCVGVWESYD